MPGLGSFPQPMPRTTMMPPIRPGGPRPGPGGQQLIGGAPPLPGTREYAAAYKTWMRTPEAQGTFQQQAVDQAKLANTINPYSQGYNADAAGALRTAAGAAPSGAAYYGAGASQFRDAMGQAFTSAPQGPVAGPGLTPIKPPMASPVAQPPVTTTGMNNFAAADSLRKKRMRPGTGGPMAPPQLA